MTAHVGFTRETYAAIKSFASKAGDNHIVAVTDSFDLFFAGDMVTVRDLHDGNNSVVAIITDFESTVQSLAERILQLQGCKWIHLVLVAVTEADLFDTLCALSPAFCVTDDDDVLRICNSVYVPTAVPTRSREVANSREYLIHRMKKMLC
jgi:glycerol-3-phosphate cytidylyltransferase-like family protein